MRSEKPLSVLLIEGDAGESARIRQLLFDNAGRRFRVQWARDLNRSEERLSERSFDAILLDLDLPGANGMDAFARVYGAARKTPTVVLCTSESEDVALRAVRAGAEDCLLKETLDAESLAHTLRYAVERRSRRQPAARQASKENPGGRVLSFWGAKGGVGTTTVVANIAASLASAGNTAIAAELRGYYGSLASQLGTASVHGDIGSLLAMDPEEISREDIRGRLTRYSSSLALLAAPRQVGECRPLTARHTGAIVDALARSAEYVVLDLPAEPSEAVGEALRKSDYVGLVLDRESSCVEAARLACRWLRHWRVDAPVGLVLVHRTPLACPVGIDEVVHELGYAVSELIPPAADSCVAATKAGVPIVEAYSDALVGTSLRALADRLAEDPIKVKRPA